MSDNELREKVAEALYREANPGLPWPSMEEERLHNVVPYPHRHYWWVKADAAIEAMRGVSAAPAPPETFVPFESEIDDEPMKLPAATPAPHYPEAVVVEDELTGKPIVKVKHYYPEQAAPAPVRMTEYGSTSPADAEADLAEQRAAAPAPPEQEQPDRNPEPWPTDEDVERAASVIYAEADGLLLEDARSMARAVLAAVGPKGER